MELPKKPTGKTKLSAWLLMAWHCLRAARPKDSGDIVFERQVDGFRAILKKQPGGSVTYRWTKVCVNGEEKWAKVARSVVYDELPDGVEEPTE